MSENEQLQVYEFQYKCRRCGAVVVEPPCIAEGAREAIRALGRGAGGTCDYNIPWPIGIHLCTGPSTGLGVMDLIGAVPKENP